MVGGQEVDPYRLGAEGQCRRKNHLTASAAQVDQGLARLQPYLVKDLHGRKIGCFTEAEVAKGALGQRSPLQPDVEGQKARQIVNPEQ